MIDTIYYLPISLAINILLFIPAFWFQTDKLTDFSYSLTFIILILLSLIMNGLNPLNIILSLLIIVWALRLGTFLVIRIWKSKKDKRFDGIRERFSSFIKFWLLQALAVWIILIPTLFFMQSPTEIFVPGLAIWLIGVLIETIADYQKYQFSRKNPGKLYTDGLWKYSRHPNYFGEILCWIGIYLMVIPSLQISEIIVSLASPLFIAVTLIFITGIPPIEEFAKKNWKEYEDYKKKTSMLIPWIPKK